MPWIWLLLALCWLATIQIRVLLEPDEARYAEVAREMWASGDWITPRLNALPYFEKPPLQYWATAAVYTLFGSSEWTARAWSWLLALACIPLTLALGRRVHGSTHTGLIAALLLAVNPYFLIIGHLNILDNAFTFFLTLAVFAFASAQSAVTAAAPQAIRERGWMLTAWAALALAVLSKGIAAMVLPGAALLVYSLISRSLLPWRRLHLSLGLPLFLVITLPWFWRVSVLNPDFARFFFIHEHFARFLTTTHHREGPWWFFLPFLAFALLPCAAAVRPAVLAAWRNRKPGTAFAADTFLLVWCGVILVFFSISQSKLPPYIQLMMPAIAVLLAPSAENSVAAVRRATWTVLAVIAISAAGLVAFSMRRGPAVPIDLLLWAGTGFLIAAAASAVLLTVRRSTAAVVSWLTLALGSILAWQVLFMAYSVMPPVRNAKQLLLDVRPQLTAATTLYSVGQYRQSIPFYLGRALRLARFKGELAFGIERHPGAYLPDLDSFALAWDRERDAIAFLEPRVYDELRARGLPGRELARDGRSIALSRK